MFSNLRQYCLDSQFLLSIRYTSGLEKIQPNPFSIYRKLTNAKVVKYLHSVT